MANLDGKERVHHMIKTCFKHIKQLDWSPWITWEAGLAGLMRTRKDDD